MTKKEQLLQEYSDWLRMRNYSLSTYKAYMGSVRNFWRYCERQQSLPTFNKETAVASFLAYRMSVENRDYSTVNGDYSALQWFYKYILNREWNVRKIIRPKKEQRLPRYITPEQVSALIGATSCKKHQLMMLLYYATGMRLSEARLLKWEDIHFEEGIILIQCGKGAKDRVVILPLDLSEQLQSYRQTQRPNQVYVFEGKTMGKPIAAKTVQWGFKRAREKAGLPNWVTAHVLRHSYATASIKNGTDLLTLKQLLGHKKLSTTTRYLHLHIPHYKRVYNPLTESCITTHLQKPLFSPPVAIKPSQPSTPSASSSASSEQPISEATNPIIENGQC